jgi:hypothetical protein
MTGRHPCKVLIIRGGTGIQPVVPDSGNFYPGRLGQRFRLLILESSHAEITKASRPTHSMAAGVIDLVFQFAAQLYDAACNLICTLHGRDSNTHTASNSSRTVHT